MLSKRISDYAPSNPPSSLSLFLMLCFFFGIVLANMLALAIQCLIDWFRECLCYYEGVV